MPSRSVHSTLAVGALVSMMLAAGCPAGGRASAAPAAESSGSGSLGPPEARRLDRGSPSSQLRDAGLGVSLELPVGWTARAGQGAVVAVAFEPAADPISIELRRWSGELAELDGLLERDPWSWLGEGPYIELPVGDGAPAVTQWREGEGEDERIAFGWFLRLDGAGLGVVARVPTRRVEDGWRVALQVVRSIARAAGA